MGTSATPSGRDDLDLDAIKDWISANSKPLLIGGAVVAVGVAGVFFARQSAQLKSERAEAAYAAAQGVYYTGNPAQAKTDLERLVTRYGGTNGAVQGGLMLAQIMYEEGKYDDGIAKLTEIQRGAPGHFAAAIEELIAAGYADSKRPDEAAAHYLKAADAAEFPAQKDGYKADAARVLMAAGKADQAKAIWTKLADDSQSQMQTEAKVRLGEMEAKAVAP